MGSGWLRSTTPCTEALVSCWFPVSSQISKNVIRALPRNCMWYHRGPARSNALPPQEDQYLRCDSTTGIENHILPSSRAGWDEGLVPFIKARHEGCPEDRNRRPAQCPIRTIRAGQCSFPRAEKQNAEDAVPDHMPGLANVEMPNAKVFPIHAKKKMKDRRENPAGVVG
jgi:hypothetical protein